MLHANVYANAYAGATPLRSDPSYIKVERPRGPINNQGRGESKMRAKEEKGSQRTTRARKLEEKGKRVPRFNSTAGYAAPID